MNKRMGRPRIPAENRKSARLHFVTTPKIKQAVELQAQNQDVTVAAVIRAALRSYLEGKENQANN